jgi:hypothetical protein
MAKQRGYPDRRGLWAESDSISELFVPSPQYKAQQKMMAETLLAAGVSVEEIKGMLSSQCNLAGEKGGEPMGDAPKDDTGVKVTQDVPLPADGSETGSRS